MQTEVHSHKKQIDVELPYLLYLPNDYEKSTDIFPLLIFLHGMGERGNDLDLIKKHGIPKKLEAGDNLPFIVVAPQCPPNTKWEYHLTILKDLIITICQTHRIDTLRIYCTGLSMGGSGTWSLITEFPDLFAAAVPICGRERNELNYPERLQHIVDLPIWHFHGDADTIVPLESARYLINHLRDYGGNPKLTIYEGVGHDSWTQTYDNPAIYDWLLSHRLNVEK